jgi:tRNA(fMet)-specific endonuclease VapC
MSEVIRGLYIRRVSSEKIKRAQRLFDSIRILPLTESAILKSAQISGDVIKKGKSTSDADCLTIGITLSHNVKIVITRNVNHFKRIKELTVEGY